MSSAGLLNLCLQVSVTGSEGFVFLLPCLLHFSSLITIKEKCMCLPFHFLEAPEVLEVSQGVSLGGEKGGGCFHNSKNESAGPGEGK